MRHTTRLYTALLEPFRAGSGLDLRLLAAFILINGLVFANATIHDPAIGYDTPSYFGYIRALSDLQLVTPQESREAFSPPLPFAFPALLMAFGGVDIVRAAKLAQLLNVFWSSGLTWFLLKAGAVLGPRVSLRLGALIFLGILPVYYKTFAFFRGEPLVACFAVVILYLLVHMVVRKQFNLSKAAILGLFMGLTALSRQWGILLFPAIFLLLGYQWVRLRQERAAIARVTALSFVVALVVGGWFYLYLQLSQGSFTAFNRQAATRFSWDNQPPEFYSGTGSGLLLRAPVRPNFPNQLAPIFYSEVWGDYWGYFSVSATDTRFSTHLNGRDLTDLLATGARPDWLETNYFTIAPYLGRVNLVSLLPSALALVSMGAAAALALSRRASPALVPGERAILGYLLVAICTTMAGFIWFVIMYPRLDKGGDTIKATYVLQLFPYVAVMVGATLQRVEARSPRLYRLLLGMLILACLHNAAAMVSHY